MAETEDAEITQTVSDAASVVVQSRVAVGPVLGAMLAIDPAAQAESKQFHMVPDPLIFKAKGGKELARIWDCYTTIVRTTTHEGDLISYAAISFKKRATWGKISWPANGTAVEFYLLKGSGILYQWTRGIRIRCGDNGKIDAHSQSFDPDIYSEIDSIWWVFPANYAYKC